MSRVGFGRGAEKERSAEFGGEKELTKEVVAELLEKRHTMINAGNKGIIFLLSEEDIPPKFRHLFPEEEKFVAKALKIYEVSDARLEYEALLKAGEIIDKNEGEEQIAKVPRALGFHDIKAGPELKTFLNKNGAHIIGEDVGIILMDYVRGEDLATILYKEVLRRKNGDLYPPERLNAFSFNELHREVANELGFYSPGKKSRDEGERQYEETMVYSKNTEKLIKFLQNSGFVLPPTVLSQIDNTVKLFHENGLFHNDLHERNVLIENSGLENPRLFIADFGSATIGKRAQEDAGFKVSEDTDIIRRLSPLTKTPQEKLLEEKLAEKKNWEDAAGKIESHPQLRKKYGIIMQYIENSDDANINNEFTISSAEEKTFNEFAAILFKIGRENDRYRNQIIKLLQTWMEDGKIRSFIKNRLSSLELQFK